MHSESGRARLTGIRRLALAAAAALPGCNDGGGEQLPGGAFFVDVAAESGVEFNHTAGGRGDYYLIETMGAGGAFFDYDGDGFLDIYLVDGFSLQGVGTGFDPVNLLSETLDYYLMSPPENGTCPFAWTGKPTVSFTGFASTPGRSSATASSGTARTTVFPT